MEIEKDCSDAQEEVPVLLQTEESLELSDISDVQLEFNSLNFTKDPHRALYFSVIQTAVEDYLFFGIRGKKSCNPEEFLSAYNYLFVTKSFDKSTWANNDSLGEVNNTEEDRKLMCFDVHYDYAGLGTVIKKAVLLNLLKTKRQKCVEESYDYLAKRMNSYRRAYQTAVNKKIKSVNYDEKYLKSVLVTPTETTISKLYFGE